MWHLLRVAARTFSSWVPQRISSFTYQAYVWSHNFWRVHPWATAVLGLSSMVIGICLLAYPVLLPWLGFGLAGITAGTFASRFQSVFLRGNTGGPFSLLQSLGARSVSSPAIFVIVGVGFIVFGVYLIFAPTGFLLRILEWGRQRYLRNRILDDLEGLLQLKSLISLFFEFCTSSAGVLVASFLKYYTVCKLYFKFLCNPSAIGFPFFKKLGCMFQQSQSIQSYFAFQSFLVR